MSAAVSSMWRKSSRCEHATCVLVYPTDAGVLVRDSKLGDASPTLSYPPGKWAALIARIKAGEQVDVDNEFFPLTFDESEREAFVAGARGGDFDG